MQLGKRPRRIIAATLLTILLTNTIAPTVTYALTSGPTAPEASSFEPVDTSDMVNLLTGDLTYNVPLVEVPGPEGGYPLALSYHAGIQPNADASWVGLGWSLNPGAITRDVNGYPDDYSNVKMTKKDFWYGGASTSFQFGVNVGIAGSPASVSFGLSAMHDTYKGFGVGIDAGIGANYGPLGIQASIGISTYGGIYASAGPSIAMGLPVGSNMALSAVGSMTISTNFKTVDAGLSGNAGLSYSHAVDGSDKPLTHSVLGISIASNGTKPSLSVGGMTASVGNTNAGKIQTSSSGFGLNIPIHPLFGVYLGARKVRYWSDETLDVYTNGVLNMEFAQPTGSGSTTGFDDHAYDTYHLHDNLYYNSVDHPDPREALGGTFPDNDNYNVTAQGLSGNIRPYAFQEELYIQNDVFDAASQKQVRQWVPPSLPHYENPQGIQYRFVNDFSNRFMQDAQNFAFSGNWIQPAFDNTPDYGKSGEAPGYDANFQQLAGSKNIEYINNLNMLPGTSHYNGKSSEKFMEPVAQGFVRRGSVNGGTELENSFNYQIGGYRITNESGVTYHYMLPAYTGSQYIYTRAKGSTSAFNIQKKDAYYAYAWYLTGVTGPDYVDVNNDGIVNEGDWGYWVSFEYGKWCDDYIWRNPEQGYQVDLDNGFETQAAGKKELYYLNKIKTATHSVIFEKEMRYDGKGISSTTNTSNFGNYPLYDGGFDGTSKSTLRLNRAWILRNEEANSISTSGGSASGHYMQNVFDASDMPGNIVANALRSVQFNYTYSLCPGTTNSYTYSNVGEKYGKLTLGSLEFKGKNGAVAVPPVRFYYDLTNPPKAGYTTQSNNRIAFGSSAFSEGDIVQFSYGNVTYYSMLKKAVGANVFDVAYLNSSIPPVGISGTATKTTNPPYNKDNYDMWNVYKSDFQAANLEMGENYARATTVNSAKSVDAWSLRTISSSLGAQINIEYESDSYIDAVLEQSYKVLAYRYDEFRQPGYWWPQEAYYTNNTDNIVFYQVRNPEVFEGVNLQIGQQFEGILYWTTLTPNGTPGGCTESGVEVLDTKELTDSYLEIKNLSYFSSHGLIGFKLNKVLSVPLGCVRMPDLGNLEFSSKAIKHNTLGGGLRTKSIAVKNAFNNQVKKTLYDYSPGDGYTSGVTSFEPSVFDDIKFMAWNPHALEFFPYYLPHHADGQKAYKKKLSYHNMQLLPLTRELPPPGVMYEYVSIANQVINPGDTDPITVEGKTRYEFEVFEDNMVGVTEISKTGPSLYPGETNPDFTLETRRLRLSNYTSRIGNVRRIIRFDNADKALSVTTNSYLSGSYSTFPDFEQSFVGALQPFSYQGIIQENFVNIRYISVNNANLGKRKAVSSIRAEYPDIMIGQSVWDYVNNTISSSTNLEYDFYSGALVKKRDMDVYGNKFITEIIPAHKKYPELSLKFNNSANKNMLTQEAATYMYKVDDNDVTLGLVGATVQTWRNSADVLTPSAGIVKQNGTGSNGNVWRKGESYQWLPDGKTTDGITPWASFTNFNWSSPAASVSSWKKTGEFTLYNTYSNPLEVKDINNNYGATKMGYKNTRTIITGAPARYAEIAFSGAEDEIVSGKFGGDVAPGNGVLIDALSTSPSNVHTGRKSLKVSANQTGFTYYGGVTDDSRRYVASVWVKSTNGSIPSGAQIYVSRLGQTPISATVTNKVANGWYLIQAIIGGYSDNPTTITCKNTGSVDLIFDDFRLQPLNATAAAYVYDPFSGELLYTLDNNNLYTRFEYDGAGKLIRSYKEKLGVGELKLNEYQYNYGVK